MNSPSPDCESVSTSLESAAPPDDAQQDTDSTQNKSGSLLWKIFVPMATLAMTVRLGRMLFLVTCYLAPRNDFGRFYLATVQFLSGESLYARSSVTPFEIPAVDTLSGQPFIIDLLNMNPPHFHFLVLPFTLLPAKAAFVAWNLISVACLIVSILLFSRELKVNWPVQARWIALFLIVGSEASREVLALGQITWIFLLPVTLLYIFARRGNWEMAGLTLGVLVVTKPFFLILAPLFLMERQWKGLLGAGLSGAATVGLGLLVFGTGNYAEWIAGLGRSDAWAWFPCSSSLWGSLFLRTLSENPNFASFADVPLPVLKTIWLALAGTMGLLTLAVIYFDKSDQRLNRAFTLLLVGAILFSPLGWVYYFWLPVPPLLALMVSWRRDAKHNPHWTWWSRNWQIALLAATVPFLITPLTFTWIGQPSPWATLFISNMNLWVALLVWGVLMFDGFRHARISLPVFPGANLKRRRLPARGLARDGGQSRTRARSDKPGSHCTPPRLCVND